MANKDIALMAHLMRRAGFGSPYDELESRATKGYEATVEELLYPEAAPDIPMDLCLRYYTNWQLMNVLVPNQTYWTFRMINTPRPLEEKICLFWHGIFCSGISKTDHGRQLQRQLDKFRKYGMGRFPDLLMHLATDPSMVYYLDNQMSHKDSINENWGRELLELFSMGVGMDGHANYTEEDVKPCSRAFTGWTVGNAMPRYPYNRYEAYFLYNPDDHDYEVKTFLGETGCWNGEDIIDIIAKQPATARFVSRHLYNFFVADEPPVPSWQDIPPQDPAAIKILEDEYFRSNYDIRSMLRVLFNSDFFKRARFAKVKSPAQVVAGTMRLVGGFDLPQPGLHTLAMEVRYMGQDLLNPPTVEGWHTGKEWINSGTLLERINFASDKAGNIDAPGVRAIIDRLGAQGSSLAPEGLVDGCLEMLGGYELPVETRGQLVAYARESGSLQPGTEPFACLVGEVLQLIVATQEYQFA
jgi:uncharacterized protein (DUF1800 family)